MIHITVLASSSSGNAYLITDGQTELLIEAGIHYKHIQRALAFRVVSRLAGCLLSHEHRDHSESICSLIKSGVDVYTSQGTAEVLNIANSHRVKQIKAQERFVVGTWTILPFEVEHDAEEPLGFLLANQDGDKLLFATDTSYLRYRFAGLTHIMIECNYALDILYQNVSLGKVSVGVKDRVLASHFSLEHVKDFLRSNDLSHVQQIHLLHLSDNNSDEERFRREVMELTGLPVYVAKK
ncbi:MBL fold metallo-hydrolase [Paenibacillus hunanensis]|uniref:Phosphoribosyl 1,2-cyclic phosphodiesterase n=1 Tax=Paenibacillus hunanensis TaxID=539262 RepID=A0ABU1IW68_9BACL|nr:MBL fold metallo-hydrolase [Paenibacillus hunanensis]MDR6243490.1 phosphoribosyl 1,2-cyclic phosphodiesterase [Paenibacillus hunanensis]GGI98137.1 MBL fold metallo-hydrolase [Paenibacillus hunanensis]